VRSVAPEVLDLMTDSMTHRGPNDRGTYQRPGVALGVRRLSIVESRGTSRFSEDGASRDSERRAYNHEEVRVNLKRPPQSRYDTEILRHLRGWPAIAR
jgi:asparagine synthase (glutamine-hydrolysing)